MLIANRKFRLICENGSVEYMTFSKPFLVLVLILDLSANLGSDHKCLLFMYRGALSVTRKLDKKGFGLLEFYEQRSHHFKNDLANMEFVSRLAYLSDIFDILNT